MVQGWPRSAAARPSDPHADLRGPWLYAVRALWLSVIAVIVVLTIIGVPARYSQLLAAADERSLSQLGLSAPAFAAYLTSLTLVSLVAHLLIGTFIYWRRSAQGMCLLVSFALITNGAIVPLVLFGQAGSITRQLQLLRDLVIFFGLVSSMLLLYVFPDGHFTPPWTRFLAPIWALVAMLAIFFPRLPVLSLTTLPAAVQVLVLLCWAGIGVYAQVYRYLHISIPVQRQQAKWASLGLLAAVLGPLSYFLPFAILPAMTGPTIPTFLYRRVGGGFFALSLASQLFTQSVFTLLLIAFPLLLAIAILRYRLWDIDLLINRALVYGSLTATLALAYFASVVVLQGLVRLLTGQSQSPVVTVVSTLAIAALFVPVRRWVQGFIDRRFYRRKYDAAQTLAEFSNSVRHEVELGRLAERLTEVVEETLQPESVSLWLRATHDEGWTQ
jgi:hypothetical protein